MSSQYFAQQSSSTPANILVLVGMGIVATQFLNTSTLPDSSIPNGQGVSQSSYVLDQSSSTTSEQNYLVGQYRIEESDKEFVETVSSFYASLSSKQEPLGRDFEKVLNENLWDLYGS